MLLMSSATTNQNHFFTIEVLIGLGLYNISVSDLFKSHESPNNNFNLWWFCNPGKSGSALQLGELEKAGHLLFL